jgi:excisionase family DNA binding protein
MIDEAIRRAVETALSPVLSRLEAMDARLQAMQANAAPPLMRLADAADKYRVHTRTIRRWAADGRIRCTRVGRVTWVDVSQLRAVAPEELDAVVAEARR